MIRWYYAFLSVLLSGLFIYSIYIINTEGDWSRLKYGIIAFFIAIFLFIKALKKE
ncbi:MAG: hypothetical protein H7A25_00585 [Leptospiraceae bacterium]|nr:hypothetical protein [Leptospiraceae bacterium]